MGIPLLQYHDMSHGGLSGLWILFHIMIFSEVLLPSFFFSSRENSKCGDEVDTKISGVGVKKNVCTKATRWYVTNMTSTRKYSWWSFLPRSLFEQYQQAAYWYFTAMAALSLAPFSPYNRFSVRLPLAFVLILGILRELWEDLRCYRGDNLVNSRPILLHDGEGHLLEKQWKHLCVGDIVKVMDGDYFPADLLLLSSTGPEGICYVETMNMDGETNLKAQIQSLQQQQQHNSTLLPTQMVSMPQQQPPLGVVTSPQALSPASTPPIPPQNLQLLTVVAKQYWDYAIFAME
ncbi:unnamed protein product [Sphagnum troendelagicum]|uniref:P-type ATPase N-terminal domain-containing protein n=1 Tax=Sphagnum troendelagicum TaxID=128251 RepID=A0ABP0UUM0_9BRYO